MNGNMGAFVCAHHMDNLLTQFSSEHSMKISDGKSGKSVCTRKIRGKAWSFRLRNFDYYRIYYCYCSLICMSTVCIAQIVKCQNEIIWCTHTHTHAHMKNGKTHARRAIRCATCVIVLAVSCVRVCVRR